MKRAPIFFSLLPALLIIGLLFLGGLLLAAVGSLGYYAPTGEANFTLAHYGALAADRELLYGLGISLAVATVSTIVSAAVGLALALSLRDAARRSKLLRVLLQSPIAIPHLAMAVVLIDILSSSGLIARVAFAVGLIHAPEQFPALIHDRFGIGIILTYIVKESPFIAVMVLAMLTRIGDEYEVAARSLGASQWQRLRHVTIPLIAPALVSASLVVFAFTFGAFDVPFLLGRTYPAMIGVVAERRYLSVDLTDRPEAIAIAVILSVITAVLVWIYLRIANRLIGIERPTIF